MSAVVWKHQLRGAVDTVALTYGAKILHFGEQLGELFLWEAHDPGETRTVDRTFQVVGTGEAAEVDPVRYVATAQMSIGLVFHLFEMTDVAHASAR